ncbi:MAG: ATP-binding protein [Deltaproteobacteria bacterium]|nr:ATP-binding protein [Deltaproteobacteria bacterium]
MIIGSAVILLGIVLVLAVRNIHRETHHMSKILSEKGAVLIKSFEAGTRTGMMSMMWGGNQVQTLLEAVSQQPGILYLAVTGQNGEIKAHSDPKRIGEQLINAENIQEMNPTDKEKWRLMGGPRGEKSFLVYRNFRPLNTTAPYGQGAPGRGHHPHMRGGRHPSWCFPSNETGEEPIIFVGLDVEPFESARREDIRNTIVLSSILLLLGLAGFLFLLVAQRYGATRRELQDTSAFFEKLVTHLPAGLVATDARHSISFCNEAAERLLGKTASALQGKHLKAALDPRLFLLLERVAEGGTIIEEEMELNLNDRHSVPVRLSAARIVNEEGIFVGSILILRDVKEVRLLQEQIRRKEKLAAVGELAAGIAHEIRNPLSSIKGMASYFKAKYANETDDREAAEVMVEEVDRLNRVISELLEFARPSQLSLKSTDLNEVVTHSLRLIEQDVKQKAIQVIRDEAEHLPPVTLDADRFTQCLLNLYLNSIQAMAQGGSLFIRTAFDPETRTFTIEVEDTGAGIDPANVSKIFDPYFTTKGTGTGLGLAIVHKIIEAHNGTIKVRSTPGKGTVFTLMLPGTLTDEGPQ